MRRFIRLIQLETIMRLLLAASLILLPAYAANAQSPADGNAKTEASKKVCKVDPEDTDSRIRRRICKTEAEWSGKTDDAKSEGDRTPTQAQ
jgi:hypothetical protein